MIVFNGQSNPSDEVAIDAFRRDGFLVFDFMPSEAKIHLGKFLKLVNERVSPASEGWDRFIEPGGLRTYWYYVYDTTRFESDEIASAIQAEVGG